MAKYYTDKEINDLLKQMTVVIDSREQVNGHVTGYFDKHKVAPPPGREASMGQFADITGKRFGRLTALKREEQVLYPCGKALTKWLCRCDCGNLIKVNLSALSTGNTKSCGCLQPERCSETHRTHGQSKTRLYIVWKQMRKRCNNPNDTVYKHYGARGIKVCDEWDNDFPAFKKWALSNGYDEQAPRGKYTIDRIDFNGDYELSNCRLITIQEQQRNKRKPKQEDEKACESI